MKSKIIKTFLAVFISIFSLNIFSLAPVSASNASASASRDVCNASGVSAEVKKAAGCSGNSNALPKAIQSILSAIIVVSGIIAVVFIVYGGIQYMTSAGDAGKIKKAKDTILYAVIGLIVCALAFAIVNFVIGSILKQK